LTALRRVKNPQDKVGGGSDLEDPELDEAEFEEPGEVYVDWAIEDLNRLRGSYLDLIEGEGVESENIEDIHRVAGDIAGQGGNYNFPLMSKVAGLLKTFVKDRTELNDLGREVVRLHFEALQTVINAKIVGDGGAAGKEVLAGLEKVIKKVSKI